MAQRFRRPCSPPATKSNPAKPFLSYALLRTTNSPQPPPARHPLPNRQPLPQEKSPLPLPLQFAHLSFPRRFLRPRRRALTRYRKRLRHPPQSKIDPPNVLSRQLQDRRHLAPHSRRAQASHPPSPSAV